MKPVQSPGTQRMSADKRTYTYNCICHTLDSLMWDSSVSESHVSEHEQQVKTGNTVMVYSQVAWFDGFVSVPTLTVFVGSQVKLHLHVSGTWSRCRRSHEDCKYSNVWSGHIRTHFATNVAAAVPGVYHPNVTKDNFFYQYACTKLVIRTPKSWIYIS